mmetsp:Transcript_128802/g.222546  ORF Transcript_128802/g.222546 Transcript_128802/m.222546 type:complete len:106 (-) Transcript_128802:258-575(-)
MLPAPGSNFCWPKGLWLGSCSRCVRLSACTQMAPRHGRAGTSHGIHLEASGQERLFPGADNKKTPNVEAAQSISGLRLTKFQGFKGPNPKSGLKPKIMVAAIKIS